MLQNSDLQTWQGPALKNKAVSFTKPKDLQYELLWELAGTIMVQAVSAQS